VPPATFGGSGLAVLPEFNITVRDLPGFHIVELQGELDMMSAVGLADALVEIAGSTVVVDLSGLTFMDSSGISAVVVARNRILADGRGRLVLTRPGAIVRKVLEIVGLSAWIVEGAPEWDESTRPASSRGRNPDRPAAMDWSVQPQVWAWIRSHLHALRQTWHITGACFIPDCEERAMHFPPSRYCTTHTSKGWRLVKVETPRTR
jgi:anti-sigma B factor antagonist